MLIAHSEEFTVNLASAESQLHLSRIFIWFEGQRVLDVALWLKGSRDRRRHTSRTSPAGVALAPCFGKAAHTGAVLPTAECRFLIIADLLCLRATGDTVSRQARMSEIVQLAVVEEVLNAAIKALADWHIFPLVVRWIELLHIKTANLQWRVHV